MQVSFSNGIIDFNDAPQKCNRDQKGRSLTRVLENYTVIDIETTGLDPSFDEIIELSAIRVREGAVSSLFSSFIKPSEPISNFITNLTGITNDMLNVAPPVSDVLPVFFSFVGNDVVVGHNVNFDINFLYDQALSLDLPPFSNDFVDTMRLSRKIFPDLKNHRLSTVAEFFCVQHPVAHRAAADCETTNATYRSIVQYVLDHGIDLDDLFKRHKTPLKAAEIHAQSDNFDHDSPFFGKVCVFTGALERMVRRDAMQLVVNMGGICGDSVTAKTNYLILGNNDYCSSIKDGKSSKQKKAESLILKGKDLIIISENVFYDMVFSNGYHGE